VILLYKTVFLGATATEKEILKILSVLRIKAIYRDCVNTHFMSVQTIDYIMFLSLGEELEKS